MRKYQYEVKTFVENNNIEANCNEIIFINTGTNVCNVNGIYLQPNQSITLSGNECEIDLTKYYCSFSGAGSSNLTVIRKLYLV